MRGWALPVAFALALSCAMPATAAVADDVRTCVQSLHDYGRPPQAHIKACTLAVNSGELDDRQLAMVLFARATLHSRSGFIDDARRDYTQAAMLNRSPGFAAYVRGAVARAEGDAAEAVRALSQALAHSPDSVDILVWRGDAFYALDEVGLALQDYEQALKRAPTLFVARVGRGAALLGLGRAEQAVGVLDELRRQNPGDMLTLFVLARARLDTGDVLGAVAAARAAEALWPREGFLRFHVARLHIAAGDIEGGVERLQHASVTRDRWFAFEARVLRFLINREATPTLYANALVAAAQTGDAPAWYLPLAHFLATAFPSPDKQVPPYPAVSVEQLVEAARDCGHEHRAWFYVGETRRLQGNATAAIAAYRQVLELGLMDTWEYRESRRRLRALQ